MATFHLTKSWVERQSRTCSTSVTVEAESEEAAIERADDLTEGQGASREGDWEDDNTDAEDEADWEVEGV